MVIEVEVPQTTISSKAIEVEYSNSNTAVAEGTKELEVTVNRREYSIVGDELYIPKRYEDAPQWLRDIIDTVTNAAISGALSDVSTLGDMLDGLIAELNVAKNTYTQSIISSNDIDERINTAITTLNSSLADSDSTILDIALTRVTPEEAQTIALGILSASIAGGDISAAVQNLQSAIADVDSARALDYTRLNASIGDEFESTATAISTINAYVGIDEAGASTGTGLSAYLEDSNGNIGGADSELANSIRVTAEGVESKFAYNSIVNINGIYKKSGFGLTTNYTSGNGTQANPYASEFWIDASRLKFTNSNQTGQTAPFTIDASGTTPQVTFNGKVTFSNVNGANMSGSNLLYNSAPAIGFETKGWQADHNDTGIASSGVVAAGDLYRPTGGGSFHQYIPGTPAVGTVFDIRAIGAIPVLGGQFYEGSAYLNSHRCDSRIYVGWRDSAGAAITYGMGDIVIQTNTSNVLSTWGRSKFIVQAPANAVSCYYYIRGTSTGEANPYVFVSMCYFGRASEGQSVFSSWSEGTSASLSSSDAAAIVNSAVNNIAWQSEVQAAINNNVTTIDGGKIVTGSIAASKINTTGLIAENISATVIVGKTIKSSTLESTTINARDIKIITDAGLYTKSVIGAKSIKSINSSTSITFYFELYKYNSTTINKQYFAKPSGNFLNLSGSTVLSAVSSSPSYNGYICIAFTSIASGTSFSITIDGYTTSIQTPSSGGAITIIHQTGIEFVAFKPEGLNYVGLFASNVSAFSLVNSNNLSITISTSSTFIGGYDFFATGYNI